MNRLAGLDAMRGLAAFAVVFFHLDLWRGREGLLSSGYLAVDLFFVLSGFVMTKVYEPQFSTALTLVDFMKLRVRRLWPAYAVGCTIGLGYLLHLGTPFALPSYGLALAFLPTPFIAEHAFAINQPGWSLTFELVANLIHVSVLANASMKKMAGWTLLFLTGFVFSAIRNDGVFMALSFSGFGSAFFRTMAAYSIGILIARYIKHNTGTPWIACVFLIPILIILSHVDETYRIICFTLFIAPTLLYFASGQASSRIASALGTLSYPIYAVHDPILLFGTDLGWSEILTLSLCLTTATITAALLEPSLSRSAFSKFWSRRVRPMAPTL